MKSLYYYLIIIICLFISTSCEKEENAVSNIQNIHLSIENGILNIYPILGEDDNCTYTIIYNLDEKEIGKVRKYPYELIYELQPEDLTIRNHLIIIETYGKYSGKMADMYFEKNYL